MERNFQTESGIFQFLYVLPCPKRHTFIKSIKVKHACLCVSYYTNTLQVYITEYVNNPLVYAFYYLLYYEIQGNID